MHLYKICLLSIITSFAPTLYCSYEKHWHEMQEVFTKLTQNLDSQSEFYETMVHPYWKKSRVALINTIHGQPDQNILNHKSIFENMLRKGKSIIQNFEVTYLKHCLSDTNRKLINNIEDTSFGNIAYDISEFNCSANTLGQMYHLGRILDSSSKKNIDSVLELGAGFGTLARITKQVLPQVTYIIIDLPEFLAIQYLYLKHTLNEITIIPHTEPNQPYLEGAIHLVPLHLIQDIKIPVTVFTSVFALSESPQRLQQAVIEKNFFDALHLYIVGQINGWNEKYIDSEYILKNIYNLFSNYYCQPYHIFDNSLWAYEVIAKRLN